MTMTNALHVIVHGRVQGVGFRFSAQARARALGLTGWVRNCDDGTVETLAQGPRDALDAYLDWLRSGPPFAHVTHLDTEQRAYDPGHATFDVR
jgi:acylphosphatase